MLSIAGSDSGGGAGIQADLKAFARCGVHGMTAITAITAQNTVGVLAVEPVSPETIVAQVRAVAEDIGVDAVKIGMMGIVPTILAVDEALDLLPPATPVVLDPVMVAESGAELLEPRARGALVERLLPRATVVTPNVPEARLLAGGALAGAGEARAPRRSRASASRGAPPTARAARTPPRWRRRWRSATIRWRRPAGPSDWPRPPSATACATSGPAPARSTCWVSRHRGTDGAVRSGPGGGIITHTRMKFLRMKPGHGEILIAEGDVEVAAEEEELVAEFRRQLDLGMWAAVPTTDGGGRREAEIVRSFQDVPRDADRVIFFPRAAGGAR